MTGRPRILVVDDERAIQTLLSYPLEGEGFEVIQALSGEMGLERFDDTVDLVLLDVSLPGIDGFEVCRRLRAQGSSVPIIMLTARTDEIDTVLGLELGADDYVTKPFSIRELTSRVRAALRRSEMLQRAASTTPEEPAEQLQVGDLTVDLAGRSVRVRGEEVRLTFSEFEIVALMATSPGRVFTREQLLEQVWGDAEYRDPRTVDVHVRHLREKLEAEPSEPQLLLTVRGVGYQIGKP
ncbi:MAG: response regulator transcription factor [Solirubrobacteraceae bacterium]|nr:response regulator transcription factor [Solirubrobacteraceae bacterium]